MSSPLNLDSESSGVLLWNIIQDGSSWKRLVKEENGVEGCCWFAQTNDQRFHTLAGSLRVGVTLLLSPFNMFRAVLLLCVPKDAIQLYHRLSRDFFSPQWSIEYADTPDALLVARSGGTTPEYAPTGHDPRFLIELEVQNDVGSPGMSWKQVGFETRMTYTALSYPTSAAESLHGSHLSENPTLDERRTVSEAFLRAYATARPRGKEYVWLDELCLSRLDDNIRGPGSVRNEQLGAIGDIFRRASQVCVFCDTGECDHTGMNCPWSKRLWTLPEIIHASKVLTMIRTGNNIQIVQCPSARTFKENMQRNAAEHGHWHLYAILQHATNSGAVSWQHAIHALVVEAIRRGEEGGYTNHNQIGKALNGLLPRRAQLTDLKGVNGWYDLEWLLELNQGFYNVASLAALCTLDIGTVDQPSPGWLGKPIAPRVGNERLEPLVNAFPVGSSSNPTSSYLHLIGPEILGVRCTLKRDGYALYHRPELKMLKRIGIGAVTLAWVFSPFVGGFGTIWISSLLYSLMELLVSSKFVVREGWVFLRDDDWKLPQDSDPNSGHPHTMVLSSQDPIFSRLIEWGRKQLIPTWGAPHARGSFNGTLIDLSTMCYTRCVANGIPNGIVPLAQHGNGITCMLVDRATGESTYLPAPKLGLANVPPHILATTQKSGSMMIGQKIKTEKSPQASIWSRFVKVVTSVKDELLRWYEAFTRPQEQREEPDVGASRVPDVSVVVGGAEVSSTTGQGPTSRVGYQRDEE